MTSESKVAAPTQSKRDSLMTHDLIARTSNLFKLNPEKLFPHKNMFFALKARDQGKENRCVAEAFCFAMYLVACRDIDEKKRLLLASSDAQPSAAYAYDACRREECNTTGRVQCKRRLYSKQGIIQHTSSANVCGGMCEDVGSSLSAMRSVCARGVVAKRHFKDNPDAFEMLKSLQPTFLDECMYYKIEPNGLSFIPVSMRSKQIASVIQRELLKGNPIVMNTYMYRSFIPFWNRLSKPNTARSVYDAAFQLPAVKRGEVCMPMGHAMVIVGIDPGTGRVRVRNSRGPDWGYQGDFCMSFSQLNHRYLASLAVIHRVQINNFMNT